MRKIDPAFDEINYGFPTFTAFLDNFSDKIETLDGDSGWYVGLREETFQNECSSKNATFSETAIVS